jgi:hypothetical protein
MYRVFFDSDFADISFLENNFLADLGGLRRILKSAQIRQNPLKSAKIRVNRLT